MLSNRQEKKTLEERAIFFIRQFNERMNCCINDTSKQHYNIASINTTLLSLLSITTNSNPVSVKKVRQIR